MEQATDELVRLMFSDDAAKDAAFADMGNTPKKKKTASKTSNNKPTEGIFKGAIEIDAAENAEEEENKKYYTFRKPLTEEGKMVFLKIPCSTNRDDKSWGWLRQEHYINQTLVKDGCKRIVRYEDKLGTYLDGRPYIVTEFIQGEPLSFYIQLTKEPNPEEIDQHKTDPEFFRTERKREEFIRQFLECLIFMHDRSVVHHDLKPDNMIIDCIVGNLHIIDFDVSINPSSLNMASGSTQGYVDPGAIGPTYYDRLGRHNDIYAFGKIVKEIYEAYSIQLSEEYRRILDKCTCERENRYESARDILKEFERSWEKEDGKTAPAKKTIRVFYNLTEDLGEERNALLEMFSALNPRLERRNVTLLPMTKDENCTVIDKDAVESSDLCLLAVGNETDKDTQDIYNYYAAKQEQLSTSGLCVLIKEGSDNGSFIEKLRDRNYRPSRFGNIDTLKNHVLINLLTLVGSHGLNEMAKVENGKVKIDDTELVNFENVSCFANNVDCQALKDEIEEIKRLRKSLRRELDEDENNEELQDRYDEICEKLQAKKKELKKNEQQLFVSSLKLAEMAKSKYSKKLSKVRELFEQGKTREADEFLDKTTLLKETEEERKVGKIVNENRKVLIDEWLMKVETSLGNMTQAYEERVQEAYDAYEQAMDLAEEIKFDERELSSICYKYACLLYKNYQPEKAIDVLNDSYKYSKIASIKYEDNETDKIQQIRILGYLGSCYKDINKYQESESKFKESMAKTLDWKESLLDGYGLDYAIALSNLADLHTNQYRFDLAESEFKEAIKIFRDFYESDSEYYGDYLPNSLNSFGNMYKLSNRYQQAEDAYKESIMIYKELVLSCGDKYKEGVAFVLYNIAVLHSAMNKISESESEFLESIEIYRELFKENSITYAPDLANGLDQLAGLYVITLNQDKLTRALELENEAQKLYEKLIEKNYLVHAKDLSIVLGNKGCVLQRLKSFSEAIEPFAKAVQIKEELVELAPEVYMPDLALNLFNLGLAEKLTKDNENAEKHLLQSIESLDKCAELGIEDYKHLREDVYNELANVYICLEQFSDAKHYVELAINENPKAMFLDTLGEIYKRIGEIANAKEIYERIMDIEPSYFENNETEFYKLMNAQS